LALLAIDLSTLTLDKEIFDINAVLNQHFNDVKLRRLDKIVSHACHFNATSSLLTLTFLNPVFNCILKVPTD
jgi:hypothetical protein